VGQAALSQLVAAGDYIGSVNGVGVQNADPTEIYAKIMQNLPGTVEIGFVGKVLPLVTKDEPGPVIAVAKVMESTAANGSQVEPPAEEGSTVGANASTAEDGTAANEAAAVGKAAGAVQVAATGTGPPAGGGPPLPTAAAAAPPEVLARRGREPVPTGWRDSAVDNPFLNGTKPTEPTLQQQAPAADDGHRGSVFAEGAVASVKEEEEEEEEEDDANPFEDDDLDLAAFNETGDGGSGDEDEMDIEDFEVVCVARGLHPFAAENSDEMDIVPGELIDVISQEHEDWWVGRVGDVYGHFPANRVEVLSEGTDLDLDLQAAVAELDILFIAEALTDFEANEAEARSC